ncbi:protein phosphatase CheZ [Pyruvatibacter mobilis]|uniref:protein phosphatase CheZ n=1 Tax=Pyruvatibacter mobilis TaxID=1712261 RepID=UPI003BA8BF93
MAEVKLFRIEKMMGLSAPAPVRAAAETPVAAVDAAPVDAEAPAPVADASGAPAPSAQAPSSPLAAVSPDITIEELTILRDRVEEATRLQSELADLSGAIERTKQELSALHYDGPAAARFQEAGNELDAVVKATEAATDTILTASERIDSAAAHLGASAPDDMSRNQAEEIAEQVVNIFEACNFQDITGQRITKVVAALQYIDERVSRMMEIWGGPQDLVSFAPEAAEQEAHEEDEAALLNGPALEDHHGHATQDDIDALFA